MFPIKEVNDVNLAFSTSVRDFIPPYREVPEEFKRRSNKYNELVGRVFFHGCDASKWKPKHGVDKNKALRHIMYVLRSWEPKHEHKIAGVAFLVSEWFEAAA